MRALCLLGVFILCCCATVCAQEGADASSSEASTGSPNESAREPRFEGKIVDKVSFLSWINLSYEDLARDLPLQAGTPLNAQALSDTLEALYARELFDFVYPKFIPTASGVHVEFVLTPKLYISTVTSFGNSTMSDDDVRRYAGIRAGQPLKVEELWKARRKLRRRYRKLGHPNAQVRMVINDSRIEPRVGIEIQIDEGYRSRVVGLQYQGSVPDAVQSELDGIANRSRGLPASDENIERLRIDVLAVLRRSSFLQASVTVDERAKIDDDVQLTFGIAPRTPIEILIEGEQAFSEDQILEALNVFARRVPLQAATLRRFPERISALYQDNGYYQAKVSLEESGSRQEGLRFKFTIEEGPILRIRKVRFEGNRVFTDRRLSRQISIEPAGFWILNRLRPGFLNSDDIEKDVETIKTYYVERGYFDVVVSSRTEVVDDGVVVIFSITEGEQRFIERVTIRWVHNGQESVEELAALIVIEPELATGTLIDASDIDNERDRLQGELFGLGYTRAVVDREVDIQSGTVTFVATPGEKTEVGRVQLQGNHYTKDSVIAQELTFESGMAWDVREVQESLRRLYSLGFFSAVQIEALDGVIDEPVEDVAVSVFERDTGSLDLGAAFTTEDGIHLVGEVAQRNILGNGSALIFGVDGYLKTGDRLFDAGRARVAYARPRFLGSEVDFSLEGFLQSSISLIDQYSFDRIGVSSFFRLPVVKDLKSSMGLIAYNERLFDVDPDVILGSEDQGRTRYILARATLDFDTRDDVYNPRDGLRTELEGSLASSVFGSEAEYASIAARQSYFYSLNRRTVLATRLGGQFLQPMGDTEVIPISQRVFLGGRNSLRGYSPYAIGPRAEDGAVVGGDVGAYASQELRYSLTDNLIGVTFIDVGQAFLLEEGTFSGDSHDFSDLRMSPGVGMHYRTPIGPISAEIGVPLDREFGERSFRLYFGIGSAF